MLNRHVKSENKENLESEVDLEAVKCIQKNLDTEICDGSICDGTFLLEEDYMQKKKKTIENKKAMLRSKIWCDMYNNEGDPIFD